MQQAQLILDTPLGWMILTGTESHIQKAHWAEEEEITVGLGTAPAEWKVNAQAQIKEYFEGDRQQFSLPLEPLGTEFQLNVWQKLLEIPFGQTTNYAAFFGKDQARATGNAIGSNPLLLLLPCHRVVGSNDELTGYAAGVQRKAALLSHERSYCSNQLSLF